MSDHIPALILTLKLDPASFDTLDTLRQRHFPPERNFLSAHITLFHALPGVEEAAVRERLRAICAKTPPFQIAFPGVRSLGRGVAVDVVSDELNALRAQLARHFHDWLTPQDRQGYRP